MAQQYLAIQLNAKVHERDVQLDENIIARKSITSIPITGHFCAILTS